MNWLARILWPSLEARLARLERRVEQLAGQGGDREAAKELTATVKESTDALGDALGIKPKP